MAYSEGLADDIRAHLADIENPVRTEDVRWHCIHGRRQHGRWGHRGRADGANRQGAHEEAIARPGTRTFDLSAKPMQGWVVVSGDGLAADADANAWIDQGVAFARTLPPK